MLVPQPVSLLIGGRSGAQQSQPGSGLSGGVGGTWTITPGAQKTGTPVGLEGPPQPKACAHRCRGKLPTAMAGKAGTRHGSEGPSCWPHLCSEAAQGSGPQGKGTRCLVQNYSRGSSAVPQWFLKTTKMRQTRPDHQADWSTAATPGCAPGLLLCLSEGRHTPTRGRVIQFTFSQITAL